MPIDWATPASVLARFLLVIALALAPLAGAQEAAASDPQTTSDSRLATGRDSFVFSAWNGPDIPVWTYVPAGVDRRSAPIAFVMHGAKRDPERYREQWIEQANEGRYVIVAPEFSREAFPGSQNYNLGGAIDRKTGKWREEDLWSFSAIEPIFDEIVARLDGKQTGYAIYGHSAGSQFVHRYLFFKPDARVTRYLAANAGWYTFADPEFDFPFGLGGLPVDGEALRDALGKDVVVLLGDQDTDPEHASLNRSEGAMRQGPHRLARGKAFFAAAREIARKNGWEFGWSLQTVDGVAHSNGGMAVAAGRLVE